MYEAFIKFVRQMYDTDDFIPLHEPRFIGNEKKYVLDTIDSTFVSSVGEYVDLFEEKLASFVGARYAIATVNGTAALHIALKLSGVSENDEVITQPLTFVATCNAIKYCGANPIFVDIDQKTLGLSASALEQFLIKYAEIESGVCINKSTKKIIKACVPMHTFGHPVEVDGIATLCEQYHIQLIEDAAESLGSYYQDKHTGTFGKMGVFSFNGNKIMTTGGGGMLVTNDLLLAKRAKHLTTTAKVPHQWEYVHNEIGYNYRMPNINAALGLAQLECLPIFLQGKRKLADHYKVFFKRYSDLTFFDEPEHTKSNYWLNTVLLKDKASRDEFLRITNDSGVMTRPAWQPMHDLGLFGDQHYDLTNTELLADCLANVPSSVVGSKLLANNYHESASIVIRRGGY
ncbi:MAG: LegC family aminotransferase [Gammaproteobacteria bacterium]|nr:LegC family aminotransferase [Gammaproteobacteria bacterium]MCH9744482.1 LegC family aminotransferase [Gammaproteobacteria bacterium]